MSRTATYHALASGELRAVKLRGRTLVAFQEGAAWLRGLPAPVIRTRG